MTTAGRHYPELSDQPPPRQGVGPDFNPYWPETVSRVPNSLRREGILETANRRITILEIGALERIASSF